MRATVPPDGASPDSSPGWISDLRDTLADPEAGSEALQRGVDLLVAQGFVSLAAVYDSGADGVPPLLAASRRDSSRRDTPSDPIRDPPVDGSERVAAHVIREGNPVLAVLAGDEWRIRAPADLAEADSPPRPRLVAVPLAARGEMLGVIVLARSGEEPSFTGDETALAGRLARPFALACAGARLRERAARLEAEVSAARAEAERSHALLHLVADAARSSTEAGLDLQAVLEAAARNVSRIVGDLCIVGLVPEGSSVLEVRAIHHPDPDAVALLRRVFDETPHRLDEGLHGHVIATGESLLLAAVTPAEVMARVRPAYHPFLERYGAGSVVIAPMRARGRVVGTIHVSRDRPGRPFSEEDRRLVQDLADQAALAAENAQLHAGALRESEARFRTLFESAPTGMALVGLDGRFVLANPAFHELVGHSDGGLSGREVSDVVHPEDRGLESEKRRLLLSGEGEGHATELRYVHRDGRTVWVSATASRVRDRAGAPQYVIQQVQDVTAHKRAEDALRTSEARLAGIVSLATEAIISIDLEQRITLFNAGAEQIFGYAAEEMMGRRLDMLIPERFHAMHSAAINTFAASGVPARRMAERGQIVGLRKNGEEFPAEASISRLVVAGETLLNVVLRDITERVRAERELADALAEAERARSEAEAAERYARFLAEAGVELSASLDYQATLAAVGRSAIPLLADYTITRVRREDGSLEVVGVAHANPAREAIVWELAGRLPAGSGANQAVDRVLETGTAELVEEIGAAERARIAPDPATREMIEALAPRSYVLAPLRARGRVLGTVALLFAESGRNYTTRDLALIQALADRAGLAVDNAGLYAAARDATRARDETLRVVAHDIGNGLSAMRLHAGLCARLLPDDEAGAAAREHARHITELVSQVQRLRQDLLDAAGLEAGALAMRFAPVDAAELVEEALERIAPLAAEKAITVTSDVPEDLPVIAADMERLLQAMGNLLGNAVKFTPSGGSVNVRAERVGGAVRVAVSDTGPGIAPEHLARVFDRFWRAPGAGGMGSGLGLAIAKGIVEAHQGVLEVESEPGEGTTFRFTFPVRPPEP